LQNDFFRACFALGGKCSAGGVHVLGGCLSLFKSWDIELGWEVDVILVQ